MNNTLENLQLLCPNCHSQTDTYAGKKNEKGKNNRIHTSKPKHTCSICGKKLDRATKSGMCKECYNKSVSRVENCPSAEELTEKKEELKSYVQIGKFYNVSGGTIKK
jgi:Zn finger protein HypA/HybF involved in hydrogenase expression